MPGFATIEPDHWISRQHMAGSFTVDLTNRSGHREDGPLHLFISFPTDKLEVTGYEGED